MDQCRVIKVIERTLTRRGEGTVEKQGRVVKQYLSLDGELLAEADPSPTMIDLRAASDLQIKDLERHIRRLAMRSGHMGVRD